MAMAVRFEVRTPWQAHGQGGAASFAGKAPAAALTAELKPPMSAAEAVAESYRCLLCGGPYADAPCATACPAAVDVPAFIEAIGGGDREGAAAIILEANPLGGTCARVCPTEVLCEGACVLVHEGQRAVEIGRLQRYAMDSVLGEDAPPPQGAPAELAEREPRGRVAVIGAGPAGLTCAAVLAEHGYEATVYDDRDEVGGLVRYAIAPYRQLADPLPAERRRLEALGVRFVRTRDGADPAEVLSAAEGADAVFLGIGMGTDTRLGVEGEDLAGVWSSLPFIAALKEGRPPAVGERVAVIGGGNTAMDVAREAVRLGAREVTVLYRRTEAEMPAYRHEFVEARDEGVNFLWLTAPVRLLGEERVTAVECRYMRLGEPDASGRRRPEPVPGTEFTLAVDSVIEAIGQEPRAAFLSRIPGVEAVHGRIVCDPATGETGNPRYFAGGDAVNGGDTVVAAVRAGKVAAAGIERYLAGRARPGRR